MLATIWRLWKAIQFYFNARTRYTVHSPRAYALVSALLDHSEDTRQFNKLEQVRTDTYANGTTYQTTDFGTGKQRKATIGHTARSASSSASKCRELYRLVSFLQPNTILEFGTNVGIATSYLSLAAPTASIQTVEGDPTLLSIARGNLAQLRLTNVTLFEGSFQSFLTQKNVPNKLDLLYLDGHHTYEATIDYLEQLLPNLHSDSVVVVDDIRWSVDMWRAWKKMQLFDGVTMSIDRHQFGYLLFDTSVRALEHLQVIDHKYKPWRVVI